MWMHSVARRIVFLIEETVVLKFVDRDVLVLPNTLAGVSNSGFLAFL